MKSEVFSLAKILNIVQSIQDAAPTDGLWDDDRSDEEQLGATYDELEWAMKYAAKNLNSQLTSRQKVVLGIYKRHHEANTHKMIPVPVCKIPVELQKI